MELPRDAESGGRLLGPAEDGSSDSWRGPWDVAALPHLLQAFDGWGQRRNWDSLLLSQMRLVVEELVVNVMTHAQPQRGQLRASGWVQVELRERGNQLRLVVSDNGLAFDPTAAAPPDLHAELEDRGVGGLGIHLARQISDHMAHEALPDGNRVTVLKGRERAP
jgi:anti-sigma regulatory factor (Ser/Thr protein kinase)